MLKDSVIVRAEGGYWLAESRALRGRQPRRPSSALPSWVTAGRHHRHMAGVKPAGDTTCRDGCHGVDDQREGRSGVSFWQGLG